MWIPSVRGLRGYCAGVCGKVRYCGLIVFGNWAGVCGDARDWGFLVYRGRAGGRECVGLDVSSVRELCGCVRKCSRY